LADYSSISELREIQKDLLSLRHRIAMVVHRRNIHAFMHYYCSSLDVAAERLEELVSDIKVVTSWESQDGPDWLQDGLDMRE
jgi:hypothetical protein